MPKISVIFVDDDQLELGFNDECRENAVYIPGTLKTHYVDRSVIGSICDLKFYKTSTSSEEISSPSYKIGSLPQGMRLREERMEEEKNKKLEKERKKKDTEKAKEENLNAFNRCLEECQCGQIKCAASGFKMCAICKSLLKTQCKKKKCVNYGKLPNMLTPKCDIRLIVADVFSDSDSDSSDAASDVASGDENLLMQTKMKTDEVEIDTVVESVTFNIGDHVVIVKEPYKGYYATIIDKSYGDEWEIEYYEKRFKWYVLKDDDHDSRVEEDMCKVCASLDNRNHATFSKIKCVANM